MAYTAPPAKAEISATPSPSNAVANAGFGKFWDWLTGLFGTSGNPEDAFDALKLLDPQLLLNLELVPSVAGSALTVTFEGNGAAALAAANPAYAAMRHATAGNGGHHRRKLTANLTFVASNGSTLGHQSAQPNWIYCYLVDSDGAGAMKAAASSSFLGHSFLGTTVAEGGAGGADSATVLYSDGAYAAKPVRYVGRMLSTQAAAGTWATVPASVEAPPLTLERQAARAVGHNLAGRTNAGTPNSKLDFTADELVVTDAQGNAVKLAGVAVTSDITAAGANGLDTGAEAANTTYHHYVAWNPATRATIGLLSASATAPVLPAGYTYHSGPVSAARNNGSANFIPFMQVGAWLYYDASQSILSAGTSTAEASVSTAAFVPSIACAIMLNARNQVQANATLGTSDLKLGTISGAVQARSLAVGAAAGQFGNDDFTVTLPNIGQNVFYDIDQGGSVTASTTSIEVIAFKLPIGGE